MSFNFPNNPAVGQIYAPSGGLVYQWNSLAWDIIGNAGAINGPRIVSNAGSPEGVVTAVPGSLCLNSSGGPPYYKNTGTGSAGWVVMT
jgi:hypothetical protein